MRKVTQPDEAEAVVNGPSVLVVDDSPHTAKALAALLRSANFHPMVFYNGETALEAVKNTVPTAAVIDIHLPDINGLILSQKLRDLMGPEKPIIILSGDTSMTTLKSLPHVGATYFFSKPVNGAQLIDRLRQWVAPVTSDGQASSA